MALVWPVIGEGRVIVMTIDGLRPDAVEILGEAGAPNFHRLRAEGASTHNARTDADFSNTLPNHTSMVTSRPVLGACGHGISFNSASTTMQIHLPEYVPGVFDVVHDHGLSTALYSGKSKIGIFEGSYNGVTGAPDVTGEDNGRDKIDLYVQNGSPAVLLERFLADLVRHRWDLSFFHFAGPDSAGHVFDWNLSLDSPYMDAVRAADAAVGEVLRVIAETPELAGGTQLIVVSDHGGTPGTNTHTASEYVTNYTIPFYVWGEGVTAGSDLYELNPHLTDPGTSQPPTLSAIQPLRSGVVGNLALDLLHLPPIPGSCINSQQILEVSVPTAFGDLYPGLDPEGDENGNGLSNFYDYAVGGDPLGRHRWDLAPRFEGGRLIVHHRTHAVDVFPVYSVTTNPESWTRLIKGFNFLPLESSETPDGRRMVLQMPIYSGRAFYRQEFLKRW